MADNSPEFDTADINGTTTIVQGTVGTSPILVPAVAGRPIDQATVRFPPRNTSGALQPSSREISVSLDGGANNIRLFPGDIAQLNLSGETQIRLVGNNNNLPYEVILKRIE